LYITYIKKIKVFALKPEPDEEEYLIKVEMTDDLLRGAGSGLSNPFVGPC
jgi:hypothetical protein